MTKLLDVNIVAPIVAMISYAVSMVLLMQGVLPDIIKVPKVAASSNKKVEEHIIDPLPEEIHQVSYEPTQIEPKYSGKSWEFHNPEMNTLQEEVKQLREKLGSDWQTLREVEGLILSEKKQLSKIRSDIERLKAEYNAFLLLTKDEQVDKLRKLSQVIRSMDSDQGVELIMTMDKAEATRLMGFFSTEELADILEKMSSKGDSGLELAAEITSGLRRVFMGDMVVTNENDLDIKLDKAESNRIAGLAEFYTSLGAKDAYAILKDTSQEMVAKILLHMVPTMQQEILSQMIAEGTIGERRARRISKAIHQSNHDSEIQKSIKDAIYYITPSESKKLQRNMDLYALMGDEELLTYLSDNFSLLEVAKLFKHLEEERKDKLLIKIIQEKTFGERRGKELAELINRMELGPETENQQASGENNPEPPGSQTN